MANHLIKKATLELVEGATKEEFDALSERVDNIVASQTADASGFKIETEIATLQIYGTDTSMSNQFLLPLNSEIVEASYKIGGSAWIFDNISVYSSETTSVLAVTVSAEFEATGENLEAYIKLVYSYPETSNIQELTDIRIGYDGTVYGSAGEAVRRQIGALHIENSGFNDNVKAALLNLLSHVAFVDENGQQYYDELEEAMEQALGVLAINVVFNQGSNVIYDTDTLDTLKQYLTVTAYYEDGSSKNVTAYTLSGTLTVGTSTITVSYGGKTDTFSVTVTQLLPSGYTKVTALKATQTGSTGSSAKQYINLGFTGDATKKYKIETEVRWETTQPSVSSNVTPVMFLSNALFIGIKNTNYLNFGYATESDIAFSTTNFDSISAEGNFATLDYEYTVNGMTRTLNRGVAVSERKAYLFAGAPSSGTGVVAPCACSMKRTKIYIDDVLTMDLVPCLRDSDSIAGMYDRISESFLHSAGANEFTYEQ